MLGFKDSRNISNETKIKRYVFFIYTLTSIFSIVNGVYIFLESKKILISIISSILFSIPISEIIIQLINYILSKTVKQKIIPK